MLTVHPINTLTNLLFEQSEDFIGIYDTNTERFERVNQAGSRMLGFASEQAFLSNPDWARALPTPPQTDQQRTTLIQTVYQLGRYEQEAEQIRQDGTRFWGRLIITPVSDDTTRYFLVRLTNQGRLHQAEHELEQSVQRYEAVFTYATIGILVCDQQGRIVSVNQMAKQLFGYADDELLGQPLEVLVPTDVGQYHERLRQSFNTNPQVRAMGHNRALHARRNDGSVFPTEISLSYFRLDDELYAVAYIIDITLKKEAERELLAHRDRIERLNADLEQKVADRTHALMNTLEQLEQSKDELAKALVAAQELGELKSRFVSMASHEFRTPLTTILTSATLVGKYADSDQLEKRQKHLLRIHSSVNHLNDILEEFLSVGRLEEGKVETNPAAVDLFPLIQDIMAEMQGMLKTGQTIRSAIHCPDPAWIDPSLLRKVLVNLLSNAIKYSGEQSVVTVRGKYAGSQLILTVTDQGVGISPDDQEHLFERFFRAKNVTNKPGTGLGLHIVARYVDLMGGTVALQSELNQGTTVTLTLPYENHSVD
ncbi:MAG: PAS domain S-box protein [Rudanella sp.]|nr:PAS domain S-box protein [Rudanella sp.]